MASTGWPSTIVAAETVSSSPTTEGESPRAVTVSGRVIVICR